jgi:hypothetical protein
VDTLARGSLVAALAIVALIGVAIWGLSEDDASRCEPVPAWFLREAEHFLPQEGRPWATAPP